MTFAQGSFPRPTFACPNAVKCYHVSQISDRGEGRCNGNSNWAVVACANVDRARVVVPEKRLTFSLASMFERGPQITSPVFQTHATIGLFFSVQIFCLPN